MEIPPSGIAVQICNWDPPSLGPLIASVSLQRTGQSPSTGTGFEWLVEVVGIGAETWGGQVVLPPSATPQAAQPLRFFEDFVPELGVIVDLTQVRWYENANDVPH